MAFPLGRRLGPMSGAHGATHRGPSLPTSRLRRSVLSVRSASTSGTPSANWIHDRPVIPSPNRRSVVAPLDKNRVTDGPRLARVQGQCASPALKVSSARLDTTSVCSREAW